MIIALTGRAFAGKDTVGEYLSRAHNFTRMSFAEPIRDGLQVMFDLPEEVFLPAHKEKVIPWITKSPRQLMQSLGTEWGRNMVVRDIWVRIMAQKIYHATMAGDDVVITDLRFISEAPMIRDIGGQIWRVWRPDGHTTAHGDHPSETESIHIKEDKLLCNAGSIDALHKEVDLALGYRMATE